MKKWILQITQDFYQEALNDPLIGYQFRKIEDFDQHIQRIAQFWSHRLYHTAKPNPNVQFQQSHLKLNLNRGELGRWLVLFEKQIQNYQETHPELKNELNRWWQMVRDFEQVMLQTEGMFKSR